jgi:hypothetical protein
MMNRAHLFTASFPLRENLSSSPELAAASKLDSGQKGEVGYGQEVD